MRYIDGVDAIARQQKCEHLSMQRVLMCQSHNACGGLDVTAMSEAGHRGFKVAQACRSTAHKIDAPIRA